MAFDWYSMNPVEFKRDTYHLCAAADGIYRRLVDEYYITEQPLPDNDQALAAIARVGLDEWMQHRDVVRAFFKSKNGKLTHKRCDQEIHARSMLAAKRSHKAKEAATVRWVKERQKQQLECNGHAHSNANAMLGDATLHNTSKITSSEYVAAREGLAREPTQRPCDVSRAELEERFRERK